MRQSGDSWETVGRQSGYNWETLGRQTIELGNRWMGYGREMLERQRDDSLEAVGRQPGWRQAVRGQLRQSGDSGEAVRKSLGENRAKVGKQSKGRQEMVSRQSGDSRGLAVGRRLGDNQDTVGRKTRGQSRNSRKIVGK